MRSGTPSSPVPHAVFTAFAFCLLAAAVCFGLGGCGYRLGADMPSVFNQNGTGTSLKTLKIKSVENPTMDPSLAYVVRSKLRDEVGARHLAAWVDSGRADYEISVIVQSYTYRSWIHDDEDISQLYSANMTLEGIVYQGNTNTVIWRSGTINYYQTYETVSQTSATDDLLRNLIRQLVDRMRQNF